MSKIIDLFGYDTTAEKQPDWQAIVAAQYCPFLEKRCYKVRKSQPDISIGTCTVDLGMNQ
jgi:Restriction endonuclease NotI